MSFEEVIKQDIFVPKIRMVVEYDFDDKKHFKAAYDHVINAMKYSGPKSASMTYMEGLDGGHYVVVTNKDKLVSKEIIEGYRDEYAKVAGILDGYLQKLINKEAEAKSKIEDKVLKED